MIETLKKVVAVQDNDCHWYVIPTYLGEALASIKQLLKELKEQQ